MEVEFCEIPPASKWTSVIEDKSLNPKLPSSRPQESSGTSSEVAFTIYGFGFFCGRHINTGDFYTDALPMWKNRFSKENPRL